MKKTAVLLFAILCSIIVNAQGYKTYLDQGQKLFNEGMYEDAITLFESARLKAEGDDTALRQVNDWLSRARKAKSANEQFSVPGETVSFPSTGGLTELKVITGSKLTVKSAPDWCAVDNDSGYLSLDAKPNKDSMARDGEIVVSMTIPKMSSKGKARLKEATIKIHQDARIPQARSIVFRTKPSGVIVNLPDDNLRGSSSQSFSLMEGVHKVILSKYNYTSYEGEILVSPEDSEETKVIDIELAPEFGVLNIDMKSTDVKSITLENMPRVRIGNYTIDSPSLLHSENLSSMDDFDILFGRVYQGGAVPIPEGLYIVSAEAEGFEPYTDTLLVHEGQQMDYTISMEPLKGKLTVTDGGGAEGARILVDRIHMGNVPATITIPADYHSIVLEKEGHISGQRSYDVEIGEDEEYNLTVTMYPYAWVSFESTPQSALVTIDNQSFNTPSKWKKIKKGEHSIHIEKPGYMSQDHILRIQDDSLYLKYELQESHPITISSDGERKYVTLLDKNNKVIVSDSLLPANLNIPYGKYKMEFHRYLANLNNLSAEDYASAKYHENIARAKGLKDIAYKGRLSFGPGTTSVKRRGYSSNKNFNFIYGTFYPLRKAIPAGKNYEMDTKSNLSLIRFSPFTGYTTSLICASIYSAPTTNNGTAAYSIPWATIAFLNGEYRIGGALSNALDLCAVGTYAWLPHPENLHLEFSFMDGLQYFLGLELNTRIPIANVSVKIGEQFFKGNANIFNGMKGNTVILDTHPFDHHATTIGISVGIGTMNSKGQSIARIWY